MESHREKHVLQLYNRSEKDYTERVQLMRAEGASMELDKLSSTEYLQLPSRKELFSSPTKQQHTTASLSPLAVFDPIERSSLVLNKATTLLDSEDSRKQWLSKRNEGVGSQSGEISEKSTKSDSLVEYTSIWSLHSQPGSILYSDEPLLFHAKLLDLLANLTFGENFVCEARLQGLMPVVNLIRALR